MGAVGSGSWVPGKTKHSQIDSMPMGLNTLPHEKFLFTFEISYLIAAA